MSAIEHAGDRVAGTEHDATYGARLDIFAVCAWQKRFDGSALDRRQGAIEDAHDVADPNLVRRSR